MQQTTSEKQEIELGSVIEVDTRQSNRKEFNYTKEIRRIVKWGQFAVVTNLVMTVLLALYLMAFYALVSRQFSEHDIITLVLFSISDFLFLVQIIVSLICLINKLQALFWIIAINICSVCLKIAAVFIQISDTAEPYLIAPALMTILQLSQCALFYYIISKWDQVPAKKWKKHLILVRKPKVQI